MFSRGGHGWYCLFYSDCWWCNANGRSHKENVQCYGDSCKQCFPRKNTLPWANVCFSEHGYFKDLVSGVPNELQTVWILRTSAKFYENTNKVPFNSNSFSLFSCFSNVLECWKLREMRFCANGLVILHICAPWEGALVAENALCWQQCFFLIHVYLHIVCTRGGKTCSMEESFAENQKYQRAHKTSL